MFEKIKTRKSLWIGLLIVMIIMVTYRCVASAQTWTALPPYNLLWPLWSPPLANVNSAAALATPFVTGVSNSNVLLTWPERNATLNGSYVASSMWMSPSDIIGAHYGSYFSTVIDKSVGALAFAPSSYELARFESSDLTNYYQGFQYGHYVPAWSQAGTNMSDISAVIGTGSLGLGGGWGVGNTQYYNLAATVPLTTYMNQATSTTGYTDPQMRTSSFYFGYPTGLP